MSLQQITWPAFLLVACCVTAQDTLNSPTPDTNFNNQYSPNPNNPYNDVNINPNNPYSSTNSPYNPYTPQTYGGGQGNVYGQNNPYGQDNNVYGPYNTPGPGWRQNDWDYRNRHATIIRET